MRSKRHRSSRQIPWRFVSLWGLTILGALCLSDIVLGVAPAAAATYATIPSRSTTIALTSDDQRLVVVNRETHSVSIIEVRNPVGQENNPPVKLAEVAVGQDPRCVAISPDDQEAYVTNALSGTVSVIALAGERRYSVVAEIPVAPELRGCALWPSGAGLWVVGHTDGNLYLIHAAMRTIVGWLPIGGNPTAIAMTNNGDANDLDETVFATQFFAELRPGGPGEGFDTGKQGIVHAFSLANAHYARIPLSPLSDVGFTADRTAFCPQTNPTLQRPDLAIFCPDVNAAPGSSVLTQDPQGCFPNQLFSAVIRGNRLWLPNICAGPEPPVQFRVNVQGAVHVVDTGALAEVATEHVNLNAQIATETQPANPRASLDRLFANDLVDIDATADGQVFLLVSRGGNYVIRATLDAASKLNIGAPNSVIRWQTGNLPNGVVISHDRRRAYVNNEADVSVTAIDLENNIILAQSIPSGEPPVPGSFEHAVLLGKLAFFTALGMPDNGIFDTDIRAIEPLQFRGKQSDNAWSSCGSCHPDGLSDGVTWLFAAGPRQTIPLDGMFAKDTNAGDQRPLNWSAVRGSNTDFNNNSRGVQGGCGFASDAFAASLNDCQMLGPMTPANLAIYDHGIIQGGSDALDVQTLWIFAAVRPLKQPPPSDAAAYGRGQTVFATNCASCHGGPKWTKSEIFYRDNPAFDKDPAQAGETLDAGVTNAGAQIVSFACDALTFRYLENVGTFDSTNPLEQRGQGGLSGTLALGGLGFNVPSLLSIRYHAPYLHHGQAQTLLDVFPLHGLGAGTIASTLPPQDQADLLVFLNAIDGTTDHLRSDGDTFRDAIKVAPCP